MNHPSVDRLTLDEKAGLVSGASFWRTRAVPRLGLDAATLTDGPHGVRIQTGEGDHLGINDSEPATAFPTGSSLGSSWDRDLVRTVGEALGAEALALGVDVLLGPGINIKRSPLGGRNFEYLSEDPVLAGALGASWVEGVQSRGVGASVKHFAANNQETDRMRIDAVVDDRTLRELYLPAFEFVVTRSDPATVMCSYNKLNGTHTSQHPWLLTDLLREDWNFSGYVVSDWGAVSDPVSSLRAGLDLEMPSTGDRSPGVITAAVRSGELDESILDRAVSRILTVHDRLRTARSDDDTADHDVHHRLARRAACAGSVLLTNNGALLPLDPARGGALAIVGEFARTPRYQGAGSSRINPTRVDDALTAIGAATAREVIFAPGFVIDDSPTDDGDLHRAAVDAAAAADTVVMFLGLPADRESEGFDRPHIDLPTDQLALLDDIVAVNPRVVVVLSNGGVVAVHSVAGKVPALLEMWLAGQASGSAAADLLFGAAEPGGRLAETVPQALAHSPAHTNWPGHHGSALYGERLYVGYRWYDTVDRDVAFPFGHGLSYTDFEYTDLQVDVPDPKHARATATLTVTNVGHRPGSTVVQLYVGALDATIDRPYRELKRFEKVHLDAGAATTVHFDLDPRAFAHWSHAEWTVDPGRYRIEVGTSSRDITDRVVIDLAVPARPTELDIDSTLDEWSAHPVGSSVLTALFDQFGGKPAEFDDPHLRVMIGPAPLPGLISMAAKVDGREVVSHLLSEVAKLTDRR